ncbi:MAG: hypothetical protein AB8G15_00065 [Saprospiraceae bacterium]
MKNLSTVLIILASLLMSTASFAQTEAQKTLVKSFNLKGNDVVVLDIPGEIEVTEWDKEIMRIQIKVAISGGSNTMLKSLVRVGRYNLRSKTNEEGFYVYAPDLQKQIKLKSGKLVEVISYEVFVPRGVTVQGATDEATSSANVSTDASL